MLFILSSDWNKNKGLLEWEKRFTSLPPLLHCQVCWVILQLLPVAHPQMDGCCRCTWVFQLLFTSLPLETNGRGLHWVTGFAMGLQDLWQPVPRSCVLGSAAESCSSLHPWPAVVSAAGEVAIAPLHATLWESSQNALEHDDLSCSLCLHNTDAAAIIRGSGHGSFCLYKRCVPVPSSKAGMY